MKKLIFIISILSIYLLPKMGWAVTYEVSPSESIQAAVDQAHPGDTVLMRGGRYYESVTITRSGLEGQPITIKAYPNEEVILDGREFVTGWQQCADDDEFLTVQSVVNPNYANIYKTTIHEDLLTGDINYFMIFEDGIHSRIARWPDAERGYGDAASTFWPVEPEAYEEKDFLWDKRLTQADNYWQGAMIDIWSHAANNNIVRRIIASNSQSSNTITFTIPLAKPISYGTDPDAYSIVNHPHILDSAGEFAHTMTPDVDGYYTFYLWPKDTDTLDSDITIPSKAMGIDSSNIEYITIDGIKIVGYTSVGIRFRARDGVESINGITIRNCIVEDFGYNGIDLLNTINTTVEYCTVTRGGNFGVYLHGLSNNALIQYNDIGATAHSSLHPSSVTNLRILYNTIRKNTGVHGSGMAIYGNCSKVLIAYNYFPLTTLKLQDINDVVVFANVFNAEDGEGTCVRTYSDWYGRTEDTQVYLNNTVLGSPVNNAMNAAHQASPPYPQNYLINNIIDGSNAWNQNETIEMTYNLYTGYSDGQVSGYGWELQEGEIDGRIYSLDQIFTSPGTGANEDYTLAVNSPVIGAGKDVSVLLEDLGITGDNPWFPGFDFTKDKAGNLWANPPSMGAYEYAARIVDSEPEPDPDPELEDDATNGIPDKTLLRISNNIIKSGSNLVVTINCDVKEAGKLIVKIYNAKGREIITLWNKHEEPGTVPITWTGVDSSGGKLGSGIYLVHMECGGYKETKKIAVIK